MTIDVKIPKLSPDIESAKVVEWLRRKGESVTKGEPLLVVETDKVTVEVDSPATGRLKEIIINEGYDARVADTVAIIDEADDGQ